jgi:hypothetical protein
MSTIRDLALDIAKTHLSRPYLWGGNDPLAGFDCSGFVIEVLRSVGVLPAQGDWTAASLLEHFKTKRVTQYEPGVLVFWGTPPHHIEMVYAVFGTTVLTIGASGGGSKTTSAAAAIQQDAYIKIRPLKAAVSAIVDPF